MLADRTDEIIGKFLSHILISADLASPHGLTVRCLANCFRLRLDIFLIILVGNRRIFGKHFLVLDRSYEESMGPEVLG